MPSVPRRTMNCRCAIWQSTLILLGAIYVQGCRQHPAFPMRYDDADVRLHDTSAEIVPVVVLRDSDCLEYLWFARQLRLRLTADGVAPPRVILLSHWPWTTETTRVAERAARSDGFAVLVSGPGLGPFMRRHPAPSMVLLDRSGRVRAAFLIPVTPNEMYAVIRAAKVLAPGRGYPEASDASPSVRRR